MSRVGRRCGWLLLGLLSAAGAQEAVEPDWLAQAQTALVAGDNGAADRAFTRHLEAQPTDAGAYFQRAKARTRLGRGGEAAADLRAALRLKPESVASAQALAELLETQGHRTAALAAYEAWLALAPEAAAARAGQQRLAAIVGAQPPAAEPAEPDPTPHVPAAPSAAIGPRVGLVANRLDPVTIEGWTNGGAETGSGHLLDYTFASAPVDWQPTGGRWEVSSRFACDPTWSFFGGWSEALAAVWNKRTLLGDQLFEAYVAFKHGLRFVAGDWGEAPVNMCLTLCGDGQNPSSGYTFIYGADEGARTIIRRGDQVLAETRNPDFLPPSYLDTRPPSEALHWRWWRLEARRTGGMLSFWVDGRKALETPDLDPLPGGQPALWTVRNGLMVARVRLAFEAEAMPTVPLVRITAEPEL